MIQNCNFEGNVSPKGQGGAIYITNFKYPHVGYGFSIKDSNFTGNIAKNGGGIAMETVALINEQFNVFENLKFEDNKAGFGGGVYFSGVSDKLLLRNLLFLGNSAEFSGGKKSFFLLFLIFFSFFIILGGIFG